jgi:hypothetical protein
MSKVPKPSRAPGLDRHAHRFLELKQELQNLEYFCRDGAGKDHEMRTERLRLPHGPGQTPRSILGVDL